ncbi:peptidylprolyl isomerase [Cerasicoccus frondis]|uniref:peptidylprolyl isomerase n=1 Tax=Cerasicoccus frondis TaxID=490090 RepID=UPI002852A398|nr:peptidylprolyl isomerase [Cerasicoccus frondis]
MKLICSILAATALMFLAASCAKKTDPEALATVGEKSIYLEDLLNRPGARPVSQTREGLTLALREAALKKAKAQRAIAAGYLDDPLVQQRIEALLATTWDQRHAPADDPREYAISEADIRSKFEQNQDQYGAPARLRAQVIVIERDSDQPQAHQLALSLLAQLRALPAADRDRQFAKNAQQHSADQASRYRAGDIGYFTEGETTRGYSPELIQALFNEARNASLADIILIETDRAVYLAKANAYQPAKQPSLDDVHERLKTQLQAHAAQQATNDYQSEILNRDVQFFYERLEGIAQTDKPSPTNAPRFSGM